MLKSMTGYGREQLLVDGMNICVEVKSVNHRYFEFSTRLPRNYGFLEEKLKKYFANSITRGKVECNVTIEAVEEGDCVVELNHPIVKGYLNAFKELSEEYGLDYNIRLSDMIRVPDVITLRKAPDDEEKISNAVLKVCESALDRFIKMRIDEGIKLKEDVSSRLDFILDKVSFIENRSPETVKEYNEKLLSRLHDMLSESHIDEQRILTESAIFADKIAVAEETVRLRSHIDQMRSFLELDEPTGKKMDFLVQEMNRETNTIGSKACDVDIARCVVDIKAEIEKIREQIQNIE